MNISEIKQDIEKLKAPLSLVRKCCSVAIKIRSTIFPLQWHFKREANGVSNSPCQIQLSALRDARALDPHGRGMRGMRAVHFWRACVSVAWRRATRTQGRWTGPRSQLLSLGLARPGRRAWLWLSPTRDGDRSGMSTVADGTPVRSNCCRSIGRCSHTTHLGC